MAISESVQTTQPPYPNKFCPGDIAIAKENINFMDGTKHYKGQEIFVTKETVSYYNVWHRIYDKK